jgi:hypothetical protein
MKVWSRIFRQTAPSPEAEFWQWFLQNEDDLYHIDRHQERTFARLSAALDRVNENLTFEFSTDERREFVISAGGIAKVFPVVRRLVEAAPLARLPRWRIVAFRQRGSLDLVIEVGGLELPPDQVRYVLEEDHDPKRRALTLYVPGFDESGEDDRAPHLGFLLLDAALGEYDVATYLGHIHFEPWHHEGYQDSRPLTELPAEFDAWKSGLDG